LRQTDLRFTTEENAAFLNRVMGLDLTDKDAAALEARTEGWIAGLQMAALSIQRQEDGLSLQVPAGIIPMLLGMMLFAFSDQVGAFFRSLGAAQILFVGCAVLAALDGAVLTAATARFQRSRLISR